MIFSFAGSLSESGWFLSQTMNSAPFFMACSMKSCPSCIVPVIATKTFPGLIFRESVWISVCCVDPRSVNNSLKVIFNPICDAFSVILALTFHNARLGTYYPSELPDISNIDLLKVNYLQFVKNIAQSWFGVYN